MGVVCGGGGGGGGGIVLYCIMFLLQETGACGQGRDSCMHTS